MPEGKLVGLIFEIAVLGCLAAGIASTSAVVGTCDMLRLGRGGGTIGPWRVGINGFADGCVGWDKGELDTDWLINMGRACSMMSLIFGCILTFFGFCKQCLLPLPIGQKLIDISGGMVQLSLALTWPMFRSSVCDKYECSWGGGSDALICAQLFYFFASVFSRCMREPRYERIQKRQDDKANETDNNLQSSLLGGDSVISETMIFSEASDI